MTNNLLPRENNKIHYGCWYLGPSHRWYNDTK